MISGLLIFGLFVPPGGGSCSSWRQFSLKNEKLRKVIIIQNVNIIDNILDVRKTVQYNKSIKMCWEVLRHVGGKLYKSS